MISWSDKFSVGIVELDDQHKQLIEMINELEESSGENDNETVIGLAIMKLDSYAHYHFATEEKLFAERGYPDAEDHTQKHQELSYQVKKIFGRFFNGGEDVREELTNLLASWLENHMLVEDMKYAEFFRGKDVS
jgi:hemerythrin